MNANSKDVVIATKPSDHLHLKLLNSQLVEEGPQRIENLPDFGFTAYHQQSGQRTTVYFIVRPTEDLRGADHQILAHTIFNHVNQVLAFDKAREFFGEVALMDRPTAMTNRGPDLGMSEHNILLPSSDKRTIRRNADRAANVLSRGRNCVIKGNTMHPAGCTIHMTLERQLHLSATTHGKVTAKDSRRLYGKFQLNGSTFKFEVWHNDCDISKLEHSDVRFAIASALNAEFPFLGLDIGEIQSNIGIDK